MRPYVDTVQPIFRGKDTRLHFVVSIPYYDPEEPNKIVLLDEEMMVNYLSHLEQLLPEAEIEYFPEHDRQYDEFLGRMLNSKWQESVL